MNSILSLSGSLLADLYLQCLSDNGFSEGLMFGEIDEKSTSQVTDANAESIQDETMFYVSQLLPCTPQEYYNGCGDIIEEKLSSLLEALPQKPTILGCYRCRLSQFSTPPFHQLGAREKAVHRALAKRSRFGHSLTLVLTGDLQNAHLHTTSYACYQFFNSRWLTIPVRLQAAAGGAVYRTCTESPACRVKGSFSQLVDKYSGKISTDTERLIKLNDDILKSLQRWGARVEESEKEIRSVESEISTLQQQITQVNLLKQGKHSRPLHHRDGENGNDENHVSEQPSKERPLSSVDDLLDLNSDDVDAQQSQDLFSSDESAPPSVSWQPYIASAEQTELDDKTPPMDEDEEVETVEAGGQTLKVHSDRKPESPLIVSIDDNVSQPTVSHPPVNKSMSKAENTKSKAENSSNSLTAKSARGRSSNRNTAETKSTSARRKEAKQENEDMFGFVDEVMMKAQNSNLSDSQEY